jgi:hypothetical protein
MKSLLCLELSPLWDRRPVKPQLYKEINGSPKFPGYPFEHMLRTKTPVVFCPLTIARPELLPSAVRIASALIPYKKQNYSDIHNDIDFGVQSHSLYSCFLWLRTPVAGFARKVHY